MDALRHNVAVTERSLKACSFRQARVQADLHAVNKALKAVVAEVKSIAGTEVEAAAKKQEEDIRVKRKAVQKVLAEATKSSRSALWKRRQPRRHFTSIVRLVHGARTSGT